MPDGDYIITPLGGPPSVSLREAVVDYNPPLMSDFTDPVVNGGFTEDVFRPGVKVLFPAQGSPYVDIEELFQERRGVAFSAHGPREYVRRFRVRMRRNWPSNERGLPTSFLHGPVAVCSCPGLPRPYSPYIPYRREEVDLKALAVHIQAEQEHGDDAQCWIVTVNYSTDMPPGGPTLGKTFMPWKTNGNQNNPWDLPPVLEYDTDSYTEYPIHDLYGRPFLDSAGRPHNPPPGVLKGDRVLTITRNERFYEDREEDFLFVVNSVTFKKSPPGYAFCTGSRAVESWLGPTKFWRVTYKVILRRRRVLANDDLNNTNPPFSPIPLLNAGYHQKLSLFGQALNDVHTIPIMRFGVPTPVPVLLDENGLRQTATRPVKDPVSGQTTQELIPTYKNFHIHRSVDLNQLLIPGQ